ncbi:MAG TPA: DUF881 domain-containing protein [Candidatus Limnocylindria bacterium]|nr:DUF881 domain-containing protein [Candidatus Limnocylindria bacterium]
MRTRGRHVAVLAISVLAGLVLVASAVTAGGTDLRAGSRTDLESLIRAGERRGDAAQAQVDRVRGEVDARTAQTRLGERARLEAQAAALGPSVGTAEITGSGVRVSLDDAPRGTSGGRPAGLGPDDLVVHQQDVQAVVNALWRGGAEGVQVMDQRLIATSAVRCVGNTLILAGRVYSPPFVITAVGDPDRLSRALATEPGVQLFRDFVPIAGLGYDERRLDDVTLVASPGPPPIEWVRSTS